MEQKILDLLLEMNSEIKGVKNEMQSMKSEIKNLKDEVQDMKSDFDLRLDKLEFKMKDGFETLELKIDDVHLKLRKSNKRLSEQIAANMENIENLKN